MIDFVETYFGLFLIFWWLIVCKLISTRGWGTLARKYEFRDKFNGKLLRNRSFGGSFHIGANVDGLYCARHFIFRPFNKPFLVPWQDIKAVRKKYLTRMGYMLMFPQVPEAMKQLYHKYDFFFFDKTFEELAAYAPEEIKTLLEGTDYNFVH